ncbi:hypothetical protein EPO04_01980 [Patescibacteria group bacterium]|nr:MAG: hypothetical protein EPO04_01980 [Patescibacteria group bacterium]
MNEAVLQNKLTLVQHGLYFSYRLGQGREALEKAYCSALAQIKNRTFAGVLHDLLTGALNSLKVFYETKLDELDLKRKIKHLRANGHYGKARRLERSLNRA